jgi:RimJ/RimL family protein N-acetyltransferase/8-oxo-dGTP pyrophosphatase MutT (NUDIX family)
MDPADGRLLWEPPGGGIDPGETPLQAARRELFEESGLPGERIVDSPLALWRSFRFSGRNHHQQEHFYLARVTSTGVDLSHIPADEVQWLKGYRWWTLDELAKTRDLVEPADIGEIAARLGAPPPWTSLRRIPHELETERLRLRQWRESDIQPLAEIYTQPGYLQFMPAHDLGQTARQVERWMRGWREDGVCQWAAVDLETDRLIGRIGLIRHHDWPLEPDPIEVGWTLHRDYWGRGLATEGGRASMQVWREQLVDDQRLLSISVPGNTRSRAVMTRLALTYRGTAYWKNLDVVWYAIDR